MAWPEFATRLAAVLYGSPCAAVACVVSAPRSVAEYHAVGDDRRVRLIHVARDQAGVSCTPAGFPAAAARCSILNAAIAPCTTSPCSIGALNFECFGPQNGMSTQRVPSVSSQVESAPQIPPSAN